MVVSQKIEYIHGHLNAVFSEKTNFFSCHISKCNKFYLIEWSQFEFSEATIHFINDKR